MEPNGHTAMQHRAEQKTLQRIIQTHGQDDSEEPSQNKSTTLHHDADRIAQHLNLGRRARVALSIEGAHQEMIDTSAQQDAGTSYERQDKLVRIPSADRAQ